ncbi:MAG: hypothetical protein HC894_03680 [Microcoleus sp. SM1_3_4]|nr:hypothetical protein [Microcoleus sp. SM1_3_4]
MTSLNSKLQTQGERGGIPPLRFALLPIDSQLSTVNCQLSTVNSFFPSFLEQISCRAPTNCQSLANS